MSAWGQQPEGPKSTARASRPSRTAGPSGDSFLRTTTHSPLAPSTLQHRHRCGRSGRHRGCNLKHRHFLAGRRGRCWKTRLVQVGSGPEARRSLGCWVGFAGSRYDLSDSAAAGVSRIFMLSRPVKTAIVMSRCHIGRNTTRQE